MINKFRFTPIIFLTLLLVSACNSEEDPVYKYPKAYLPVYPGSVWVYSNGEVSKTDADYVKHSYEASITNNDKTSDVYLPVWDGKYVYEYSVTQASNLYPVKKLMEEKDTSGRWIVNDYNGLVTYRQMVKQPDSLVITFYGGEKPVDSVFKNIYSVIEFTEGSTSKKWHLKEYYVKNIGLVKTEIQDASLPDPAITTYKTIIDYKINR